MNGLFVVHFSLFPAAMSGGGGMTAACCIFPAAMRLALMAALLVAVTSDLAEAAPFEKRVRYFVNVTLLCLLHI